MDLRGFTTSVSVEESDFLEEFMSCDFSSTRDKNNIGSLTDLRKASVFDLDLKMFFLLPVRFTVHSMFSTLGKVFD